jgi:uncharacterized protein
MDDSQSQTLLLTLSRIADALEVANGTKRPTPPSNWDLSPAYVWEAKSHSVKTVKGFEALPLTLLVGIGDQAKTLHANTMAFAGGYPANHVLLWGARGMGKSSLVKSVFAAIQKDSPALKLIEIHREDLASLPSLLDLVRGAPEYRFILFCDDLSFDTHDDRYKSLKAVLEGGVEARPANAVFYATSNRRHLLARDMIENERDTAIHGGESVEEKVSLSDRFGLWLGFYPCAQDAYLAMIDGYCKAYGLIYRPEDALEWFRTRGARSGRVAWQFVQHLAGVQKKTL